jgi:cysteinyl-tRNA synthetase
MLNLYNTLTKTIQPLQPLDGKTVRIYTCGPTVYHYAHIGNLRSYIFSDLLRRTIEYNNLPLKHGMNITDVGHLVSDADEGEDKMELGAKREGKHPLEIAKFYETKFLEDLKDLNIEPPHELVKATETISEQIEIIKLLTEKGFTYQDDLAIYFDTSKLSDYGKLSGQKLNDKKTGAREDVVVDSHKRHPQDFALWFFLAGHYQDHVLHWPSPWGDGFPGWHIECSAISRKILGQPFDIHTGGVDHIGTHHTNEIAQSEAAFGLPLANIWMHGEFLLIDNGRMGKSEGNAYILDYIKEKGFSALDYRYLCLTAHYRTQLNFTEESLQSAKTALNKLYDFVRNAESAKVGCAEYEQKFIEAINDDLNIPKALGVVWEMINDASQPSSAKMQSLLKFDKVLGLKLDQPPQIVIPEEVQILADEREQARLAKDFSKSDELRDKIAALGFEVEDTASGPKLKQK